MINSELSNKSDLEQRIFEQTENKDSGISSKAKIQISILRRQLKKYSIVEREEILKNIYKQIVPRRRNRISRGVFNKIVNESEVSANYIAKEIFKEMAKYPGTKHHARKLKSAYKF